MASEHVHYLRLDVAHQQAPERCSCMGCGDPIPQGAHCVAGTVETCRDPAVEILATWCWSCFRVLGRLTGNALVN